MIELVKYVESLSSLEGVTIIEQGAGNILFLKDGDKFSLTLFEGNKGFSLVYFYKSTQSIIEIPFADALEVVNKLNSKSERDARVSYIKEIDAFAIITVNRWYPEDALLFNNPALKVELNRRLKIVFLSMVVETWRMAVDLSTAMSNYFIGRHLSENNSEEGM